MAPKNALLIDDDQDDLDILKEQIFVTDPEVLCMEFVNPREALRVIFEEMVICPDFVFVDINMPGIRGEEVVKELRTNPDLADTTIVVFSTSMPEHIAQYVKDLGANHAFAKPVKLDDYAPILKRIFEV